MKKYKAIPELMQSIWEKLLKRYICYLIAMTPDPSNRVKTQQKLHFKNFTTICDIQLSKFDFI